MFYCKPKQFDAGIVLSCHQLSIVSLPVLTNLDFWRPVVTIYIFLF